LLISSSSKQLTNTVLLSTYHVQGTVLGAILYRLQNYHKNKTYETSFDVVSKLKRIIQVIGIDEK